jgi:arylsulfatase A-like enzyme
MSRRGIIRDVPTALSRRKFLAAPAVAALAAQSKPRPNIVFLASDQHSSDMLGCYGNPQVISPNLDRLASEGIRFRHCISNSPVCSAFRGMLMSGQHPLYNGVFCNDVGIRPGIVKYFGEVLRDSGYRMGYVGKWHLYGGDRKRPIPAGPDRLGFDDMFYSDNCTLQLGPKDSFYWNEKNERVLYHEWQPFGQAKQAVSFLDNCKPDQPFALFVSVHPPHNFGREQYKTELELMARYAGVDITLRPNVVDRPELHEWYRGHMAMITGVDTAFGRILDKLKEKGFDQNTIVVFTADHGDLLNSHGRTWPKSFPESESSRVPLLMRLPNRLRAGTVSDQLIGSLDLMPTLLGLMGAPIPSTCQGKNLASAIRRGSSDAADSVPFFYFDPGWRGVYTHRYTYSVAEPGSSKDPAFNWNTLYDREKDPFEQTNLFDSPSHRSVKDHLHQQTFAWMAKFHDPFPTGAELMKLCFNEKPQTILLQRPDNCRPPANPVDLLARK